MLRQLMGRFCIGRDLEDPILNRELRKLLSSREDICDDFKQLYIKCHENFSDEDIAAAAGVRVIDIERQSQEGADEVADSELDLTWCELEFGQEAINHNQKAWDHGVMYSGIVGTIGPGRPDPPDSLL
jgi:hypothetical protein